MILFSFSFFYFDFFLIYIYFIFSSFFLFIFLSWFVSLLSFVVIILFHLHKYIYIYFFFIYFHLRVSDKRTEMNTGIQRTHTAISIGLKPPFSSHLPLYLYSRFLFFRNWNRKQEWIQKEFKSLYFSLTDSNMKRGFGHGKKPEKEREKNT